MKVSFVLASTLHGPLIFNRNDFVRTGPSTGYGLGWQLLQRGAYDLDEVTKVIELLRLKRRYRGDGAVVADVGANIGVMTVTWAKATEGWENVYAFECQERLFYALCGNIALNNCRNARAFLGVVTTRDGTQQLVPQLDYDNFGSYGSLSLVHGQSGDVRQEVDWSQAVSVRTYSLDSFFSIGRLDLLKVDVEGMEFDVLIGGAETIDRERPILSVEHIKSDREVITKWMEEREYVVTVDGMNLLAIHRSDPVLGHVRER